ncbi:MAG: PEGA domain-containing protein, partial [Myxococcota bacterium]|nr:PEGA domain-containing protein [Myxococcota bacterium]
TEPETPPTEPETPPTEPETPPTEPETPPTEPETPPTEPETPPEPSKPRVSVRFSSDPSGARVSAGNQSCKTPCSLELELGETLRVRVKKTKYKDASRSIEVSKGSAEHFKLSPELQGL